MAPRRSRARPLWLALGAFIALRACSADGVGPGDGDDLPVGGSGGSAGAGGSKVIPPEAGAPGAGEGGASGIDPRCGVVLCDPDDSTSCKDFAPTALQQIPAAGAAGEGGAGGQAGAGGSAGAGAPAAGGAVGGTTGGAEAGSAGASGSEGGVSEYACQVTSLPEPTSQCAPSGRGAAGDPCLSGRDCAAGLGCVEDGVVGRCRPFCCGGEGSCDGYPGTYCGERSVLEDPAPRRPALVPVCVVAENCDLSKPPCSESDTCECPEDTACHVVRPDGTTACVEDGSGTAGMACPCQWGHVCSQAVNRCLVLCKTGKTPADPTCPRCQGSAELPDGWGVCID